MALTVKCYSVSKAVNSTALPTGAALAEYECRMLDACSILRPVILLNVGPQANPTGANYCYIPEYSRYYWITDWTVNRGQWMASLSVDVLASWKTEIGNSTQYVVRSSKASTPQLPDSTYPALTKQQVINTPISETGSPFTSQLDQGEYVVGIVGKSGTGMGAVNYYIFTAAQFKAFGQLLYGEPNIFDPPADMDLSLFKIQFNPLQYIVYCKWFPMVLPKGAGRSTVDFGWWEISANCYNMSATPIFDRLYNFTVPSHPQASRGTYLNASPYSRYTLHFKPFGEIPVDASFVAHEGKLSAIMRVDLMTGMGLLSLATKNAQNIITVQRTQIGVDVSLAQIAINPLKALTGAVQVGLAAATGGASLLLGGLTGISNAIDGLVPQMRTSGSNGSLAEYFDAPMLESQFFYVADEDLEHLGRPLCQKSKISELGGFVQTAYTELDIPATSGEIDMIKSYMEGGMHFD